MTISERIFELLDKRGMSQKEFSEKTGIAQSSISDWKRKKTNPVSEKILIICKQPVRYDTDRQKFGIWQRYNGFSCPG